MKIVIHIYVLDVEYLFVVFICSIKRGVGATGIFGYC